MDKIEQSKQLVLLFGATGKTGFHIANRLFESENYPVRVVVRSKAKLQKLFKEKQMAFQSIIEGDILDQQILKKAFQESQYFGSVKIVISALGAGRQSEKEIQKIQYTGVRKIIGFSRQFKIDKFIFISAALMERPWNLITVMLNIMIPNVYHYKAHAQNQLRNSGLNYIIIRPPRLVGNQTDTKVSGYDLKQGDNVNGQISRRTLGEVVFHSLNCIQIPSKVTFQCLKNNNKKECQPQNFSILKQDTDKSIVKANHKLAKYTYLTVQTVGILGFGWFLYNKYAIK